MKQTLLKLSTILMLTLGTAMGADDAGATVASGDEKWGKHFAIAVTTGGGINYCNICGCQEQLTMTLNELLLVQGVEQAPETSITILKTTDNVSAILTAEELAELGFTPDQNFGALPLSQLNAFGFPKNAQPEYCLSIIGPLFTQPLVAQDAQAVQNLLTMMFVFDRLTAPTNDGQPSFVVLTPEALMSMIAASAAASDGSSAPTDVN